MLRATYAATVLALVNYEAITGAGSSTINSLPWLHLLIVAATVVTAIHVRAKRSADTSGWARRSSTAGIENDGVP